MHAMTSPEHPRPHYAWLICGTATLAVFCAAGLLTTAFSVYQPYLAEKLSLTNTQSSLIVLTRNIVSVTCLLMLDRVVPHVSLRIFIPFCMLLSATSFVLFGLAESFAVCCLAAGIAGASSGFCGAAMGTLLIARWFNEHRGIATGICISSTGLSAFIASPVIALVAENFSLRTAFLSEGCFVVLCAALAAAVIRNSPAEAGMEPLGTAGEVKKVRSYLRRPVSGTTYLLVFLAVFILGISSNCFYSCLSLHYKTLDYTGAQIAMIVSAYGLSLASGKIVFGELSDRIGSFRTANIMYVIAMVGFELCVLARFHIFPIALAGTAIAGFGISVAAGINSFYAVDLAVEADYPMLLARFQFCITFGGMVLSPVMGMLADRFGNYVIPFRLLMLALLVSALMIQSLYRKIRREDQAES